MTSKVYRQSKDCTLEVIKGEVLLYLPSTARALRLNEPSRIVWQLCDGKRSVEEIIAAISEQYPDQADEIARDVPTTIELLTEHKALEPLD